MNDRIKERPEFLARIKPLGEHRVRERTRAGQWSVLHRAWASQWLRKIEHLHAEEERAAAAESNRLAREANDKAHTANVIATVAIAISIISIAGTIISAFVK